MTRAARVALGAVMVLTACGGDDTDATDADGTDIADDGDPADGDPGDASSRCHGLDLSDCRTTAGCKPDECAGCGCSVTYRGCLDEAETAAVCPALGCPQGSCCSSELDCALDAGTCTPPGAPAGCGPCNPAPGDCTTDADCDATGPSFVCDPIACSCDGSRSCVPGCVDDTTCGTGTHCDVASARCVALACSGGTPCPANFICTGGACARVACTDDRECDGYCVGGACYADRGECRVPPP